MTDAKPWVPLAFRAEPDDGRLAHVLPDEYRAMCAAARAGGWRSTSHVSCVFSNHGRARKWAACVRAGLSLAGLAGPHRRLTPAGRTLLALATSGAIVCTPCPTDHTPTEPRQ